MTQSDFNNLPRAVMVFGLLIAVGLILGAFILGAQAGGLGAGRSTVNVKGLAERPVKADLAEWRVAAEVVGTTFAEALAKLREEKKALDQFLESQGFDNSSRKNEDENVEPNYVEKDIEGRIVRTQEGFLARQYVAINSKSLDRIAAAHKAALDFKASGHSIEYANPNYLVSNLEEVKMSLISAATENAKKRADEFIKHSNAQLGSMRSASQGAFYILRDSADAKIDEYGGTYDKSTIDKIARVVVTIEFNLR
jgi:hypothetical protein